MSKNDLDLKDMFGDELTFECDVEDDKKEIAQIIEFKISHFNKYDFERMKVMTMFDGLTILNNENYIDMVNDLFDKICISVKYKQLSKNENFKDEDFLTLDIVTKRYYLYNIVKKINEKLRELKKK